MKYFKTYEEFLSESKLKDKKELEDFIIQWMEDNQMDKVDLPKIKEVVKLSSSITHWILKFIYLNDKYDPNDIDDDPYKIIATIINIKGKNEELINDYFDCSLTDVWEIDTLKQISDYLQGLTPEQIENQRAKNEAEKFNF